MLTLQRAGRAAAVAAHLKSSPTATATHRRCVILLLQAHQQQQKPWTDLSRFQSSSAASSSAQALHAHSFISRKNVGTSSARNAETTLATASGAFGTPTKKTRPHLPPNMVFRSAGHSTLAALDMAHVETQTYSKEVAATTATRPLVVLFAWMLSKNVHIEKYRKFWTERGYDILTVQTSPLDLLFPAVGGRKIAVNVFDFLATITPRYDQVVVHAFSVGGYQLCEFLFRMSEGVQAGDPEAVKVFQSMKGLIIDSCVFADDCAPGLSKAITHHPIVQPMIEASITNFLKITKSFTMNRYHKIQAYLFDNERKIPGLLLISRDDVVSNVQTNMQLAEGWLKAKIPARVKCWDKSVHVLHYKEHPEEYEYEVDRFITEIDITKVPKRRPVPPPA